MSECTYTTARKWARIVANCWQHPEFSRDFELDPVSAMTQWKEQLGLDFEPGERLLRIPPNPGYTRADLLGCLLDDAIVPITSFAIHGLSTPPMET